MIVKILLLPLLEIDILTEVLEVGNGSDPTHCTNYSICLFFLYGLFQGVESEL